MSDVAIPLEQNVIVDITESQMAVVIYANQEDDESRIAKINVFNEGEYFDLSEYTVVFREKKTDGYAYTNIVGTNGFGNVKGNVVTIPINKTMTISPGRQICDLKLTNVLDRSKVHTCIFYIQVREESVKSKDVIDSNEYKDVEDMYISYMEQTKKIMDSKTNEIASFGEPYPQIVGDFWLELL